MNLKALVLTLVVPAFFLIGCGQMETSQGTAGTAIENLTNNGAISEEEAESIDESMLEENVEVADTGTGNSIMMKVGGADLLIDFLSNLTGVGDEIAMIINGVEVPSSIAGNAQSMQGLVASLVTSQLEGIDILGIPVMDLVQTGLGLISGGGNQGSNMSGMSGLFGTLIRGALNMFMGGSPIGMIVGALAGPLIDNVLDNVFDNGGSNNNQSNGAGNQGQNNNNNNNNNNNSGGGFLGTIVDTIGGVFGGGSNNSSPLGGIFNLITNLFK